MTVHEMIEAQAVQVGDRVYNKSASHPAYAWDRVKEVTQNGTTVTLHTFTGPNHIYHARQGVAVKRGS